MTAADEKPVTTPEGDEPVSGTKVVNYPGDENVVRGNWSSRIEFPLSLIGYAVGLINVWRFLYLCVFHGGSAFFIPYTLLLVFMGVPLFYLELAVGQFTSRGPFHCWQFAMLFRGVGVAQIVCSLIMAIYYNMIIGWAIFYLFSTFIHATEPLPWSNCDNSWNTFLCASRLPTVECNETLDEIAFDNGTCYNGTQLIGVWSLKLFENMTHLLRTTPSQEYFNNRVLHLSSSIDNMGPVIWDLALVLLAAWVITFVFMIGSIKCIGKLVYFTAICPYSLIIVLIIRGATLPNGLEGMKFFLSPDFSRLAVGGVWADAALEVFFTTTCACGGLITLSSYNKFHHQYLWDVIVVSIINFATGILAGMAVFSFLGFLAHIQDTSIADIDTSGPGLMFVTMPAALVLIPAPTFWSIFFFFLLIVMGMDTQVINVEVLMTVLNDQFPAWPKFKPLFLVIICGGCYLLGLPLCTQGGAYLLQLLDTYAVHWGILVIAFIECIAFAWIYGCQRLYNDIRIMTGERPSPFWGFCLRYVTPALLAVFVVVILTEFKPTKYGMYTLPAWADVLGMSISVLYIVCVIGVAGYYIFWTPGSLLQRLRTLTRPTKYWGPALVKFRRLVNYVDGFVVDPWSADGDTKDSANELHPINGSSKSTPRYVNDENDRLY